MPMPKTVLEKYKNEVFVETGTLYGEAVKLAHDVGFKEVHSIDIDAGLIANQNRDHAGQPGMHFYCGSSGTLLPGILKGIKGRTTFWLDAHPPGLELKLSDTPLVQELQAITEYARGLDASCRPTVLIDDMRIFTPADRKILEDTLKAMYPGEIFHEDSHIATADILGYRPV